jgi:hypothetical protein
MTVSGIGVHLMLKTDIQGRQGRKLASFALKWHSNPNVN